MSRARDDRALFWLARAAGAPSGTHADDRGTLAPSCDPGTLANGVVRDEALHRARARATRAANARAYRDALDAQVATRARMDGREALRERSRNAANARGRDAAAAAAARAHAEERKRRDAYVEALDRQVAERRERERRAREEAERRDREENERIRRAVEEERDVLRQKRAAMAAREASSSATTTDDGTRRARITHSPPVSPRPSPSPSPTATTFRARAGSDAAVFAGGYEPVPERVVDDDDGDLFDDENDDPFGHPPDVVPDAVSLDAASAEELASIVRELVVEMRDVRARLARAERALEARSAPRQR